MLYHIKKQENKTSKQIPKLLWLIDKVDLSLLLGPSSSKFAFETSFKPSNVPSNVISSLIISPSLVSPKGTSPKKLSLAKYLEK